MDKRVCRAVNDRELQRPEEWNDKKSPVILKDEPGWLQISTLDFQYEAANHGK